MFFCYLQQVSKWQKYMFTTVLVCAGSTALCGSEDCAMTPFVALLLLLHVLPVLGEARSSRRPSSAASGQVMLSLSSAFNFSSSWKDGNNKRISKHSISSWNCGSPERLPWTGVFFKIWGKFVSLYGLKKLKKLYSLAQHQNVLDLYQNERMFQKWNINT